MKISDMKLLMAMHEKWVELRKELHFVYEIYETNLNMNFKPLQECKQESVTMFAEKFLKAVAMLYFEDYDDTNQCVNLHLKHGTYTLVYDKNIHEEEPKFIGLRLSTFVENWEDNELTQEEIIRFFDDNVGYDFRDTTIE